MPVSTPSFDVPPLSTDCHVHVLDPARFAYDLGRTYTPAPATTAALLDFEERLGMQQIVLVQPSCYGLDNRALLDALQVIGVDRARGVAVIDCREPDAGQLRELHAAGVRGIRLNWATQSPQDLGTLRDQLAQAQRAISPLEWNLQLHCKSALLVDLLPELLRSPCPIVLDHFANLHAEEAWPGSAAWAAVQTLLDAGRTYVKLSAAYRISAKPASPEVTALARALIEAAPERMLWGSDWPHTGGSGVRTVSIADVEPFRPEDAGATLSLVTTWAPEAEQRHQILVDNPAALFGF